MTEKVIVLGANGRFGRAALHAFNDAGWHTSAFGRSWPNTAENQSTKLITGDALSEQQLGDACSNHDVIVNALNPPYSRWHKDLPRLSKSVINAAKRSGATVIVPGNVYNYGKDMPERLTEHTPLNPSSSLGQLRCNMEQDYRSASTHGVQTIVIRAGDFIEGAKTGNWFDTYILGKLAQGKVVYPGPLNCVHNWAYLPDLAAATVLLAEKRTHFALFEEFGFPGYSLTGQELISTIKSLITRPVKISSIPWPLLRILGIVFPNIKGVAEMSYLWFRPHTIDGSKLSRTLSCLKSTPYRDAIKKALSDLQ